MVKVFNYVVYPKRTLVEQLSECYLVFEELSLYLEFI